MCYSINKHQNGGTMVGVDKNKLGDILKKGLDPKAEEAKPTIAAPTQKYNPTSGTVFSGAGSAASVKAAENDLKAVQAARIGGRHQEAGRSAAFQNTPRPDQRGIQSRREVGHCPLGSAARC